jgi:hypothetical protein
MAVLRTPNETPAYVDPVRVLDGARASAPGRAHARAARRARSWFAMVVYSTGYPLLALALWFGAHNGEWTKASTFVALGVIMSFIGWAMLSVAERMNDGESHDEREQQPVPVSVYVTLYNRAGAIVILLGSYAVAASTLGWPVPQTFVGWFVLVWVPLFITFAIPIECSSRSSDSHSSDSHE